MRSLLVIVAFLAACASKHKAPPPMQETKPAEPVMIMPAPVEAAAPSPKLATAERDAYTNAKPVFDKYCTKCHVQGADKATAKKLEHFDMTSYPFGGHHADVIGPTIAKVLGLTGKKATMPSDNKGAVQGEELALVKAWVDAWSAAHPGKPPEHHHH